MKKQNSIFFYVLGVYVVLQFAWWGYHLIELSNELDQQKAEVSNRVLMIMGEGLVFFLILIVGLWRIRSASKKELKYSERQNNFLLSVTHELKTPLAANKLFLQTVLKRDLEKSKREELIEKAIAENSRLEVMIDNILNASRIENKMLQVHFESFDLIDFLKVIAEKFNKIHQREVVQTDFIEKIEIKADKFMIEMCVNNLIENALKYGDSNKSILLYCKLTDDNQVKFGVKDEGSGVPLAFQKEIFDKFVRNENEETRLQKGTGLGLFITSEFVKIHKGKIKYYDNVPKGANFEITLKL
jgi:K+-sensing histidine kinase KdpD